MLTPSRVSLSGHNILGEAVEAVVAVEEPLEEGEIQEPLEEGEIYPNKYP